MEGDGAKDHGRLEPARADGGHSVGFFRAVLVVRLDRSAIRGRRTTSPAMRFSMRWPITEGHADFLPSRSIGASWATSATWRRARRPPSGLSGSASRRCRCPRRSTRSTSSCPATPCRSAWRRSSGRACCERRDARPPARYSDLVGDAGAEKSRSSASSGVHDILEADAATLPSLLEAYIRDHIGAGNGNVAGAHRYPAVAAQSRPRFPDCRRSAKPHQYRPRRECPAREIDAKRESINALAAFVAERLLERNRRRRRQELGQRDDRRRSDEPAVERGGCRGPPRAHRRADRRGSRPPLERCSRRKGSP